MSQGSKWRWWSILLVKTRPPKQLHKLPMWQRRSGPWRELGSFQPAISPQRPYLVIAYGIIPSARIPPFLPVVSQSYVNREACWGGNIKTPRKANTPELPPPMCLPVDICAADRWNKQGQDCTLHRICFWVHSCWRLFSSAQDQSWMMT